MLRRRVLRLESFRCCHLDLDRRHRSLRCSSGLRHGEAYDEQRPKGSVQAAAANEDRVSASGLPPTVFDLGKYRWDSRHVAVATRGGQSIGFSRT